MTPTTAETMGAVEVFRHQARMVQEVVHLNVDGLTHEESLIQPQPEGNCLNWVIGHLVWTYDYNLPMLGQEPVMDEGALERYAKDSAPLRDPADALAFREFLAAWDEATERMDAGIAKLTADTLDRPAERSPGDVADETIRERLTGVLFHQAYHAGQTALLRRIAGKDGAI